MKIISFIQKPIYVILCSLCFITFYMSTASLAAEQEDLVQQIKILQDKVDAIEKKQTATGNGFIELQGLETSMKIGGYVKLDMIYSDASAGEHSVADEFLIGQEIPLDGEHEEDQLVVHSRQSRFFIHTETPSDYGSVKTHVEGDFFGGGGNSFRLRHAYGELGGLLAGQTWTTFMDVGALPETLDFGGPVAALFVRQAQIRWTQPFSMGSFQFALENPGSSLMGSDGSGIKPDDDQAPDIIGRLNIKAGGSNFAIIGIARELCIDDATTNDTEWGGAASVSGSVPTIGKDNLQFQFNYGNALGRYMVTDFADAVINGKNEIETVDQWGGYVSYRHFWADTVRSSLMYSYGEADYDSALVPGDTVENLQSIHTNLLWNPVAQVTTGIEYIWGKKELINGDDGDVNKCQVSLQYNFF